MNKQLKKFLIELNSLLTKHSASIYFSVDSYMEWDMEICVNEITHQKCFIFNDENGIDVEIITELLNKTNENKTKRN